MTGWKSDKLIASQVMQRRSVFKTLLRIFATGPLLFVLIGATGWAVLAIYFGDSSTSTTQTLLAAAFGLVGVISIVGIFLPRWRIRIVSTFALLFGAVLLWWFNITPLNDRPWQADVAQLPYATINGDQVTVHNVRNFTYRTETDYIPAYYTKTYDLSKLESIDLYAVYWMGPAIAHTIVSFGFDGDDYLAVSIEARKEQSEGYSAIKGFFRQYELIYVVADERDVIRLRTNYRKDPPEDVYLYRLRGSPKIGQHFFLEYMKSINELIDHPRFYNTLLTNCTNVIWMNAHINPDRVPFSWKILASGYAPEYLYDMGRLDTSMPFEEIKQRGYVSPIAQNMDASSDFSQKIRTNIK
jgi:hypothetical protein